MLDPLLILEKVNQFYTQSFNQLVIITVAVLAFAGVIMPLLTSLYQKRLFKLEHDDIKKQVKNELMEEFAIQVENIKKIYEEKDLSYQKKLEEIDSKIDKKIAGVSAVTMHIQANISMRNNSYNSGFKDLISAAIGYIKSENEVNLRRVINLLINKCLPKLTKATVVSDDEATEKYEEFIISLLEVNQNDRYKDDIKNLKRQYKQATERDTVVKNA